MALEENPRQEALRRYEEERARNFEAIIDRDPGLGLRTILDPLGTFSRFGMIDHTDTSLDIRVTEGSMLDVVHLREAVESRGLDAILAQPAPEEERSARRAAIAVVIDVQVCVTICRANVCVTICVRGQKQL